MTETQKIAILRKIEGCLSQEEYEAFYKYFSYLETLDTQKNNQNIFELIETYFGRPLNPLEYEMINGWEDSELTRHAIKEAILRRAYNVKYINTIITNYKKQGIQSVQEAQMAEQRYLNRQKKYANQNYVDVDKAYKEFLGEEIR